MSGLGATAADRSFKWGVGPYLDGMFTQGSFGIVTQVTLALARTPARVDAFYFFLNQDTQLEGAVEAVRQALRETGGTIGGINLMNSLRVLSMSVPYPQGQGRDGRAMSAEMLEGLRREAKLGAWMGMGAIYGNAELSSAARATVKRVLGPRVSRLLFFRSSTLRKVGSALARVPLGVTRPIARLVDKMQSGLALLEGRPSEVALRLAYWRGKPPPTDQPLNPARDRCGILWYAPLVPMKADRVRTYAELAQRICREHGVEPLLTLTSLNERCFDSTLPLLFDQEDAAQSRRVEACYAALFEQGKAEGFVPYRLGAQSMELMVDGAQPFWSTVAKLKSALDPKGILSPGRYAPLKG